MSLPSTQLTERAPMPAKWVSRIFAELQGNYGSKFLGMWATGETLPNGTDAGLSIAMQVWGQKLAGFADKPEAIKSVLATLPTFPPTLPEFLAMCRNAAQATLPVSARITNDPTAEEIEIAKATMAKAAGTMKTTIGAPDPLRWCKQPGSQIAMNAILEEVKNRKNTFLAGVLHELVESGICTADGKLLRRWERGEWVVCGGTA
jgi:hypothetical protein